MAIFVTQIVDYTGPIYIRELMKRAKRGADNAANIYKRELERTLSQVVGSIPATSSKNAGNRRQLRHSAPGQPPFVQTFNLASSLTISQSSGSRILQRGRLTTRISTRVPYAKTLELGGTFNLPQTSSLRRWARWTLTNPIPQNKTPTIAPRPAWIPVFNRTRVEMVNAIKRELI
jgi:hypothetical protein